ncbi:hypothetical protein [Hymenobacter cellulosilyticus]|uniref:T9SS type A sorting domain-containing protein n=1 Tax=Hymenobacter cellulosilyticus TaxID=2932248 RepID=A0A8T9Q1P7_9BACT|nr:hypothetical protein [Hymenobacter cellulosilyticus]UOQ71404.1 hypothetical protein MUN79_22705 [Hymenobacter cellulosilyticus]
MTKPLLIMRGLLVLLGLLAASGAQASHIQASEISYVSLGNNRYKVSFRVYRDCGGALFNSINPDLKYRTTACSVLSTPGVPMTLVSGSYHIGKDYCATVGEPCGSGLPTNYETGLFEATVTLPAGQWTLSVTLNARPTLGNVNIGSGDLYTEATLDNTNGVVNSSPVFSTTAQVVSFVGWNLPTTFSEQAVDPDGDSLTYELVAPLMSCSEPLTYKSYGSSSTPDPVDPTCITSLPAATYSPTFPLPSFNLTGTCPQRQLQPYFEFDRQNGSISMRPTLYNAAVNSSDNKHVVAVKVSEYRRSINSQGRRVATLVGTVRRDMMFTVVDCGDNRNPVLAPITVNNSPVTQPVTEVIPVVAGRLVTVRLRATDVNAGQVLTMTSNVEQVLPNSEFTAAPPSVSPTVQIDWIPPVNLSPGLYYCTVTTTDSNCPYKGIQTQTLTFRVSSPALATQAAKSTTTLTAVPTPFQTQVSFTLARPGVQQVLVFDQLGRQVTTLLSLPSGQVQWSPAASVPAGLYLARTADGRQVARLLRTDAE